MASSYEPRTPRPRDRLSPPIVEQHPPARYDPVPHQAKAYPFLSRWPEAKPLAAAGRSISHNVLPTEVYSAHHTIDLNPLANPGRPALVQSYSTTALADTHPLPLSKPGRFATGPMRIVRPAPMMSADGQDGEQATINVDGFFYTPSGATVLRGPVRPPPTIGHNRRPMGQAQRRVVTAPGTVNGDLIIGKTPAMKRVLSRNIQEKIVEDEERAKSASPAKPAESLQPIQIQIPTAISAPGPSESEVADQPDSEEDDAKVESAPLESDHADAVLAKAQDGVRLSLALLDETPVTVPAEIAAQIPLPIESPQEETTTPEVIPPTEAGNEPVEVDNTEVNIPAHEEVEGEKETESDEEIAAEVVVKISTTDKEDSDSEASKMVQSEAGEIVCYPAVVEEEPVSKTETTPSVVEEPAPSGTEPVTVVDATPKQVSENPRVEPAPLAAATTSTATTKPRLEPRLPPARSAAPRTVSGRSDKQAPSDTSKAATGPLLSRKPPVPRAAAVTRIARPIDRKPFRPTTAAESAAARVVSTGASAKAVVRPPVTQTTKPTEITRPAVSGVRSRVPSASASSTVSTDSRAAQTAKADSTAVRPTKPSSTLHAPTKASASRAAPTVGQQTQRIVSTGSNTASTHTTSISTALPPVRKERIKLKAALPSFRPVRQGQSTSSSASGAMQAKSAGTSSSTLAPQGRAGGAKVRPESIPLPNSPSSKNISNAPFFNNVSTLSSQGSGRARVRPESIPPHISPQITQTSTSPYIANQLSASLSPTARAGPESIPLPSTPVSVPQTQSLSLPSLNPTKDTETPAVPAPRLNDLGLPLPIIRDRFESSRSKTSDAPTASVSDFDSDAESDDEIDDLEGVTFKPQSQFQPQHSSSNTTSMVGEAISNGAGGRPPSRPRVVSADIENTITLSHTPHSQNQKGYAIGTAPTATVATPSRKALVFRDANVATPAVPAVPAVSTLSQNVGPDEMVNA